MKIKPFFIALAIFTTIGLLYFYSSPKNSSVIEIPDALPHNVTLSGTYTCLPLLDKTIPQPTDCVFGLKTDEGVYYMVNFGQSVEGVEEFQKRAHIVADGFYMYKESLNTDQWQKYNMKGIFTITNKITSSESTPTPTSKQFVCTQEAEICPDGSTVSRTGPKCEFAACPPVVTPSAMCDYAAPPQGCNYVSGPNYNPQNGCGMVLKCQN